MELWLQVVRQIAGPTEGRSLLDLCCRDCVGTRFLGCKPHMGVDVFKPAPAYDGCELVVADVLDYLSGAKAEPRFDICICCDGIEHLSRDGGVTLLREMERVSNLAIIFTPLGGMWVDESNTHPDAHKSAWWPADFAGRGWEVEVYPDWHPEWKMGAFFAWKRNV